MPLNHSIAQPHGKDSGCAREEQRQELVEYIERELKRSAPADFIFSVAYLPVKHTLFKVQAIQRREELVAACATFRHRLASPGIFITTTAAESFCDSFRRVKFGSRNDRGYPQSGAKCRSSCVGRPSASGEGGFA